jgi:hypothetical protein
MLDTIRFLETLGSNPMSDSDYANAVTGLNVDATQRDALLNRDQTALNDLLGGRSSMFFGILAPHESPLDDEPAEDRPDELPADGGSAD